MDLNTNQQAYYHDNNNKTDRATQVILWEGLFFYINDYWLCFLYTYHKWDGISYSCTKVVTIFVQVDALTSTLLVFVVLWQNAIVNQYHLHDM